MNKGVGELAKTNTKKKTRTSRVRPRWTKEEVALLKRLYRTHSNAEIAHLVFSSVSIPFSGPAHQSARTRRGA